MSWGQMREMRDAGMWFGSHTHTHRNLATLDASEVSDELRISKDTLEQGFGEPVTMLAYPYGKPRVHFTYDGTPAVGAPGRVYELAGRGAGARDVRATDSEGSRCRGFFATRDDVAKP